jgi:hypothetical protein
MSETQGSPSTPERGRIAPPDIEGVPDHIQPSQREALRKKQHPALNWRLQTLGHGETLSDDDEHTLIENIIDEHLEASGVAPDDPAYNAQKALLQETAVDSIYETNWYNAQTVDGETTPARREEIFQRLEEDYKPEAATDPEDESEPEAEVSSEHLKLLAQKKHALYAQLINVPIFAGKRRKEAQERYDQAEKEYHDALRQDVKRETAAANLPEDQQAEYVRTLYNQRFNADNAAQHAALIEKGGIRARALEKYSEFSTKKKIAYGLGLGALGAGAGFALGAAGASAAAIAAGIKIYGVSRTYYLGKAKIYQKPSDTAMEFTVADGGDRDIHEQAAAYAHEYNRTVIEQAEKTKKRALKFGLGAAALTGAAGAAGAWAHSGMDGHWKAGYLEHIGDQKVSAAADVKGSSLGDIPPGLLDDHISRMQDAARQIAEQAQAHEHAVGSYVESHAAGVDVTKGEGWYNTFKEFGVSGGNRDDLLKEIGPQLEKMGEAYRTEDGLWGISHPGELSDDASRLIVDTANEHGWLHGGIDAAPTAEAVPNAVQEIKPGEGILQTLKDAGVENPTLHDVSAVQDQLVTDGAAYANGPGGYAGLNLNGGNMNQAGINTVMDYADNKQLDGSTLTNTPNHIVGTGADAVNYDTLQGVEDAGNDHLSYLDATEMRNDIHEMSDLLKTGNLDAINTSADYQDALHYVHQDLKGVNYPGTDIPVIEAKYTMGGEQWKFNPVPPNSHIPARALNTLIAYEQSKFALAS